MNANPLGIPLEPEAQAFCEAGEVIPYLYTVPPSEKRRMLDELQARPTPRPDVEEEWVLVGDVPVRMVRPPGADGPLPTLLFVHGGGWVMGNASTHDRLVRELAVGAHIAVAFPEYTLSPEARFPTALEECWAVAEWLAGRATAEAPLAVGGDQMGATIACGLALLAIRRGGVDFAHQLLFYPATDTAFDTDSYQQFAVGYALRAQGYRDFWDQYCPDPDTRRDPVAAPLRTSPDELALLPPATVITAEADCLRDEGEAYAGALRTAGVPVLSVRYHGVTNGFVMLDAMRTTHAADAAINQAAAVLRTNLHPGATAKRAPTL
ncbi:lipase [Streptomyces davaonensis JCM 4913]|uniref:Lipase n=1 Tax=Streptomyces davaonensis (strain DSM 101723 / JCM 4913 / KCC S-0913 / 768) TaxID=1214101 RepID=K4R698_STRDJ|nr:alpha/beta hydrolase [Streptomyces davaonensis]CCK28848.1 lipase [Streptomyces davaonensis JCM 4913]